MLITRLTPDFVFEDDRGVLTQLVSDGYRQVNVVFSKQGTVRGGHYHKENVEALYVISGELTVEASLDGEKQSERFSAGDMFLLSPGTVHSMTYIKDTFLVVMYDKGVENPDGTKDIIPFVKED